MLLTLFTLMYHRIFIAAHFTHSRAVGHCSIVEAGDEGNDTPIARQVSDIAVRYTCNFPAHWTDDFISSLFSAATD